MQRTQTRLRIGFGLVAMMAVLALVAFMTMVSSNGTTTVSATGPTSTPAATPTPGGTFKILAVVNKVDAKAGDQSTATLTITKEGAQIIAVDDKVLWKGQRWTVTARGANDVTLSANPCASQASEYPQSEDAIYQPTNLCDDGFLTGIWDIEIPPFYHCIFRLNHEDKTDLVTMSAYCGSDTETGDTAYVLYGVYPPGEGPDNSQAGPPAPPPYYIIPVTTGTGEYFPAGNAACPAAITSCLVVDLCFPDIGTGALGPNILARMSVDDPHLTPDSNVGTLGMLVGSSVAACDAIDPSLNSPPDVWPVGGLPIITADPAGASPTTWRTAAGSATDYDGDGCSDLDELDTKTRPKGCGDDPFSPLDSNNSDHTGSYEIRVRVLRAEASPGFGGIYFACLADIVQTGTDLEGRAFCYTDGFVQEVNKLDSPGVTGDGFPGGSPPYLAIPAVGPPETNCARGLAGTSLDDDGDTVPNDGCPSEAFGDLDSKHTVLTGVVNGNNLELRGCFEDEDASSSVGTVYVEMLANKNTGLGTVDIWTEQTSAHCVAGAPFGSYVGDGGAPGPPVGAFDDAEISIVRQPGGQTRDTDQDGIPNAVELRDNGTANCGLRDPFNPYDWYDVNQDGVIDLLNDILGVISHYSPGGAPPYHANWDRPPAMTGGAGHWNRGAPDGVIDLLNDILGVISQYHPGAC